MLIGWIIVYVGLLGLGVSLALVFWCYYPKNIKLKISNKDKKNESVIIKEKVHLETVNVEMSDNVEMDDNETELLDGIYGDETELLHGIYGDETELLHEELSKNPEAIGSETEL